MITAATMGMFKRRRLLRIMVIAAGFAYLHFQTTLTSDLTLIPSGASRGGEEESSSIKTTNTTFQQFSNPSYSSGSYGRIAFRLHTLSDTTVNPPGKYDPVPKHQCQNSSILTHEKGVLDFKVSVSTDLNMIFIGDSIASQLAQAFDATVLEPHYDYKSNSIKSYFHYESDVDHICVTQSTPIRGGGASAYMRNNYMMSSSNMMRAYACKHGSKTWGTNVVNSLLYNQHPVDMEDDQPGEQSESTRGRSFDAAILKIPALGWLKHIRDVTKERIIEEINLIGQYFGVETVIISTLTFSNNVKTIADWNGIRRVNEMIRKIAKDWEILPTNDRGNVRWILVQELGNFTNQMIWTNAKHIGYTYVDLDFSRNGWDVDNPDFLFDRFELKSKFHWPPSIPMVCADRPTDTTNVRSCEQNQISPDGTHWCTPTVGPRYSASIACLLGCVYNGEFGYLVGVVETFNVTNESVRVCEQECNHRFMSLVPVEDKWIDASATIYSKSSI